MTGIKTRITDLGISHRGMDMQVGTLFDLDDVKKDGGRTLLNSWVTKIVFDHDSRKFILEIWDSKSNKLLYTKTCNKYRQARKALSYWIVTPEFVESNRYRGQEIEIQTYKGGFKWVVRYKNGSIYASRDPFDKKPDAILGAKAEIDKQMDKRDKAEQHA